jgi:L-arabinose isomerase
MLILSLLTGQPTHNTDWLDPMPDGSIVFTHCGSGSYSLAEKREEITLAPVRLAHQGVCSLFPARPGFVTLVNLMPRGDDYQMAVMEGEAIETEMVFPGNPLRVRFSTPCERIINWIYEEGIGHHWIAGYGYVRRELEDLACMIGPGLRFLTL